MTQSKENNQEGRESVLNARKRTLARSECERAIAADTPRSARHGMILDIRFEIQCRYDQIRHEDTWRIPSP